jgi:hypothetical protein
VMMRWGSYFYTRFMHGQVGICRRASAYESKNIMMMRKRMRRRTST